MGYKNIVTTQLYTKITTEKIDKDLTMFDNQLNQSFSFSELVVLFDVVAPILKAAIRAMHKSGVIAECTQYCEMIPYTYWATLYNMDMIVALAFCINSYGAEKIRHEVLKRISGRKEKNTNEDFYK